MNFPLELGPISPTIATLQATPSLVTCSKVTLWACPHLSHHCSSTPLQSYWRCMSVSLTCSGHSLSHHQFHSYSLTIKMNFFFLKLFRALSLTPPAPQLFSHNQNEFLFPKAVQGTLSHPTAPQLSGLKNSRSACEFLFLQAVQPTLSHTNAGLYQHHWLKSWRVVKGACV